MRVLHRAVAIVGGLLLAWAITLVAAEIIGTLLAPAFEGISWPAWFPTTPIILATMGIWFLLARAIWRIRLQRRKPQS
jgi:hypothetical protein